MGRMRRRFSALDDYLVGRHRIRQDGSIELRGKRWSLVLLTLAPPLLIFRALSQTIIEKGMMDSPWLALSQVGAALLIAAVVALFVWPPRRIIVFDAVTGGILICQKGLLQRRGSLRVGVDEIEELRLEGGEKGGSFARPRLFLKTVSRELYLASLGEWLAGQNLVKDLQAMVSSWKRTPS